MSGFLLATAAKFAVGWMLVCGLICILAATELAFPRPRMITLEARLRAILFSFLYFASISLSAAFAYRLLHAIGYEPLISIQGWAGVIAAALAVAFVSDFFYYWYHRAQHSIGWLWRIHAVHHSAEELGAGCGYHHLAEGPLKAVLVGIPAALVIDRASDPYFAAVLTMQAVYIHSSTRLNFGKLAWLISDNRAHRIHHSLEPRHFDRNFGAFTLLWDRLFGTASFPTRGEWPDVGLAGQPEPRSMRELVRLRRSRLTTRPDPSARTL